MSAARGWIRHVIIGIGSVIVGSLGYFVLVALVQDVLIFPGVIQGQFEALGLFIDDVPQDISELKVVSRDGTRINLWKLAAPSTTRTSKVALLFHGNGDRVGTQYDVQQWFQAQGITSYDFDYRGFGKSGGWPSEQGIYEDSEAIWNYILEAEGVNPAQMIVMGISVGTGPAAYLAHNHRPGSLLLLAPYLSIPDVVAEMPIFGLLPAKDFLHFNFPVAEYVTDLAPTCVVVAHGKDDSVIPPSHGERLAELVDRKSRSLHIFEEGVDHFNVFPMLQTKLKGAIDRCFETADHARGV